MAAVVAVCVGQILQYRARRREDKIDILKTFMGNRKALSEMFIVPLTQETSREYVRSYNLIPIVFGKQKKVMSALMAWENTHPKPQEEGEKMKNLLTSLTDNSANTVKDFLGSHGSEVAKYWRNVSLSHTDKVAIDMAQAFRSLTMENAMKLISLIDTFPRQDKDEIQNFWNSLKIENENRIEMHKASLETLIRAMADEVGYKNAQFAL